jgi:putative transcriptional regulator
MISIRSVLLAIALVIAPTMMSDAALTQPDDTQQQDFLTGQLLIASPDMGDPRFAHAVILMIRHDRNGAFGLIVNRPVKEEDLARLLDDLGANSDGVTGKIEIYLGGPVQTQLGFVLHSAEYHRPETVAIDANVAATSSPDVLRDIAEQHGPQKFIFAFGYAGWGPGQLEGELKRQAWFTAPDDPKLLFDDDRAKLWQDAISRRSRAL